LELWEPSQHLLIDTGKPIELYIKITPYIYIYIYIYIIFKHAKTEQPTGEMCAGTNVDLHVQCPLLLSDFAQNRDAAVRFIKSPNIESHTKTRSARFFELLQTVGQADMVKPTGAFWKLLVSKAQKNTRH